MRSTILTVLGFIIVSCVFSVPLNDSRIVGGSDAPTGSYPFQISMQLAIGSSIAMSCGGVILSSNKVATAAHCCDFLQYPDTFDYADAVAGASNVKNPEEGTQQRRQIVDFTIHPLYDKYVPNGYDVCKLEIHGEYNFNEWVQPISLCPLRPAEDSVCNTTGWGRTSSDDPSIPNVLQQVSLTVINQATCEAVYALDSSHTVISVEMLCAGGGEKGACQRDSGGPLACHTETGRCLAGITSFGLEPCGHWATVFMDTANPLISVFLNN